jgi:hypothetical protein
MLRQAGRCHLEVHEEVDAVVAAEIRNLRKTYVHVDERARR